MAAPIVSIKHILNQEDSAIASGAVRVVPIIVAVAQLAAVATPQDVVEGSIIKAVHIEHWFKSTAASGSGCKFQLVIEKVIAGQASITFAQMNNLNLYPNKKNVLYISQGIVGDLNTRTIPIFNDWIGIPKGKQRFGLGDEFTMTISSTNAASRSCGIVVYKEYK